MVKIISFLLIILPFRTSETCWSLNKETLIFKHCFLTNPHLIVGSDSIVFNISFPFINSDFSKKSDEPIIHAYEAWVNDSNMAWLLYQDQNKMDFWEKHFRKKNAGNFFDDREMLDYPKKYMKDFAKDHGFQIEEILIYKSSSLSPRTNYPKCNDCYSGEDYLIKIRKSFLRKFSLMVPDEIIGIKNKTR